MGGRELAIIFKSTLSSFLSLWCCHYAYVGALNGVPHFFEALRLIFLHSFVSHCCSAYITSISLSSSSLFLSSSCLNIPFSPSNNFRNSIIKLFNARISICFFLKSIFYLLIDFLYSMRHYLYTFFEFFNYSFL